MSEHFAEATVQIKPILTGFVKDLEKELKTKMAAVKSPVIRIKPALSVDFVGSLRKQVNAAVLQAQKGIKPIVIKGLIQPVGTTGHILPAGATGGGGGGGKAPIERRVSETTRINQAQKALATTTARLANINNKLLLETTELGKAQTRLRETMAAGNTAQRAVAASAETTDAALKKQALDLQKDIELKVADAAATLRLAETNKAAAATASVTTRAREPRGLTTFGSALGASTRSLRDAADASKDLEIKTKNLGAAQSAVTLNQQGATHARRALSIAETEGADKARILAKENLTFANQQVAASKSIVNQIKKQVSEETKGARAHEQFSRGGQASLLSLAGIRGATLAASRSFLVGAAAITVFAKAVKSFADLETNLDVFRATTSATAAQMEAVRDAARKLGADLTLPSVSAGDAAGAMVELAKAGLTVQASIEGARGVLELATAANIDNAAAVQLVANALNAFQLEGRDAALVADTFANAANAAQGSIADIGTAFQQAAAAGRQVGLSFQDTSVFLTILAKNGLRGSDAGTSLRTALIRLVNPSKEAAARFKELGIVLRDAQGNIRPDVFIQIAQATKALTPAARDAAIALIGGQDAFRAITILGRQSIGSFLRMRAALREEGTAAELAAARTRGLHGAVNALQSVLETVGTDAAKNVGPGLAGATRGLASMVTAMGESEQVAKTLKDALHALGSTLNFLGQSMALVARVALPLASGLQQITNAIGVSTILGALVVYKLFPRVLATASAAAAAFTLRLGILATAIAEEATVLAGLRVGIGAMAAGMSGIGLAAAVAAAALIFLITRQTAAERAAKSAKEATDNLATAFVGVKNASETLANEQRGIEQVHLRIRQAALDRARAERELAASSAQPGTAERRQLLLNLAITTQDLTFATDDYRKALKNLQAVEEDNAAAADLLTKRHTEEKKTITDLIAVTAKQAAFRFGRINQGNPKTDEAIRGRQKASIEAVIASLEKLSRQEIESGDAERAAFGRRIALIKGFVNATGNIKVKPILLSAIFEAPNLKVALGSIVKQMTFTSVQARNAFIENIVKLAGLGPKLSANLIAALEGTVHTAAEWAKRKGGPEVGAGLATGIVEGFKANFNVTDAIATAMAQGASTAQLLAVAQASQASAQAKFNKINTATKGGTFFKSEEQQKAFEAARDELNTANAEVERLNGEITTAAKDSAQKIKDAQDKRDQSGQKIVDSILEGRKATILQNKITSAGLTDWLGDDLKSNRAWIVFLRHQKKVLIDRLKTIGASKAVIDAFRKQVDALIFGITNTIKELKKDQEANTKARKEALNAVINERLDLRIQIAESKGNLAAQIRAHRAKLKEITKELVAAKKQYGINSIEWLRLKAAQVDEISKIKELEKTTGERNNALQQLQFEFLQSQQGFAANLLGNLIPTNAAGGLVGNPGATTTGGGIPPAQINTQLPFGGNHPGSSPTAGLAARTALADTGGPTRGGQSRELMLLEEIKNILAGIKRGTGAPDSQYHKAQSAAVGQAHSDR